MALRMPQGPTKGASWSSLSSTVADKGDFNEILEARDKLNDTRGRDPDLEDF